jgi:hypothetical protein
MFGFRECCWKLPPTSMPKRKPSKPVIEPPPTHTPARYPRRPAPHDRFPTDPRPVQITKLPIGGAKFRTENVLTPGSRVVLERPDRALRLDGIISRAAGADAAMVFDPASGTDPALTRLPHAPA